MIRWRCPPVSPLCQLCEKRRARRYCPGVKGEICSQCCGTERENTIDCPTDCPHLQEARRHEAAAEPAEYPNADIRVDFGLTAVAISLQGVTVNAAVPLAVDTRSGDQRFKQDQYHGAPTNTTSQILQQSIAGAARAPTGEVHIRGQHAEYTYYADGVPVPAGISGSLNELFEPNVVNEIDFKTGGWDAEYGNKNTAIIDITTRIPAGGLHYQASGYAGNYNTYGQGLSASTNAGKIGYFFSGSRFSVPKTEWAIAIHPAFSLCQTVIIRSGSVGRGWPLSLPRMTTM